MQEGSVLPFFCCKKDMILEKHVIYKLKIKEKHVI